MIVAGALLILLACSFWGLSAARRLKDAVKDLEDLHRMIGRMQSLVCLRVLPLNEVWRMLAPEFSSLLKIQNIECNSADDDLCFLPEIPVAGHIFPELTAALSAGEEPEKAFEIALSRLEEQRRDALEREKKYGRLYIALGFCIGCFLVLLLV